MEALTIIAAALCVGGTNILCFLVGAKTGQRVAEGKPVEMPTVDPMKVFREHKERKEAEREQSRIDTILRNVDRYDGTGAGQEEVM